MVFQFFLTLLARNKLATFVVTAFPKNGRIKTGLAGTVPPHYVLRVAS